MKTIKLTSQDKSIDVEYLVDIIGSNEQFSIYDAVQFVNGVSQSGVNGTAIAFGMPDENVNIDKRVTANGATHTTMTLTQAVAFAVEKNLTMIVLEDGQAPVTKNTLTPLAWVTAALDAGVCGNAQLEVLTVPVVAEAQVETITAPTTAAAAQGDYVVFSNNDNTTFAAWLDIDAAGTAPTGAIYVAADNKIKVSIVAGGTAADTAAAIVAAVEANPNWTGITLLDNLDGTITLTHNVKADVDNSLPKNADDTGAGSIAVAVGNVGLDGIQQGDYVVLTNALTGDKVALWFDVDAAGTVPTGALYVAADFKVEVNVATGATAIANATAAFTALGTSDWSDEVTLTDNGDGTIDVQQDYAGVCAAGVEKNSNDSGAGNVSAATSLLGSVGTPYSMALVVVGGNTPYVFTTASTMPEGLTLSAAGVISGTPREAGTFPLTIKATDMFGVEATLTAKNLVISAA